MTRLGFSCGGEDGLRQLGGFFQAGGQFNAANCLALPIFLPARAGQVAANDTLDARFTLDVAVVCGCIVLALALGAVTLRRRTG